MKDLHQSRYTTSPEVPQASPSEVAMVMMALPTDSADLKAKPQLSSSRHASSQEAPQVSLLVVAMAVTTVPRIDSVSLAAKPNNPPPHSE